MKSPSPSTSEERTLLGTESGSLIFMSVFAQYVIYVTLSMLLLLSLLSLTSCGGSKSQLGSPRELGELDDSSRAGSQNAGSKVRRPVALLVESSHSGPFYGKNLAEPTALLSSSEGFVFLIDRGNQRLIKFDYSLNPLAEIGGSRSFRDFFDEPSAIALSGSYLFVGDAESDQIHRLDLQLNLVDALEFEDEDDAFRFGLALGLAVTVDEDLWVVDGSQRRIAVFDRNFEFVEFISDYNRGGYSLRKPGSALSLSGNRLVVCDSELGELALFDDRGSELGMIGKGVLRSPSDIAESADGSLWVADSLLNEIVCLSQDGDLLFSTSQTGSAFASLNPTGICVLPGDSLLISDSGSGQLLVCRIYYSE